MDVDGWEEVTNSGGTAGAAVAPLFPVSHTIGTTAAR